MAKPNNQANSKPVASKVEAAKEGEANAQSSAAPQNHAAGEEGAAVDGVGESAPATAEAKPSKQKSLDHIPRKFHKFQ